jgi:uncharacterized cupin superfamily protein
MNKQIILNVPVKDLDIQESTRDAATSWISDACELSRFGAFIEVLQPGAQSSTEHWHSAEDEMVYVLDGEATPVEEETDTVLRPGDAATFRSGVAVGHMHHRSGP